VLCSGSWWGQCIVFVLVSIVFVVERRPFIICGISQGGKRNLLDVACQVLDHLQLTFPCALSAKWAVVGSPGLPQAMAYCHVFHPFFLGSEWLTTIGTVWMETYPWAEIFIQVMSKEMISSPSKYC
jgi:hypothetical protein